MGDLPAVDAGQGEKRDALGAGLTERRGTCIRSRAGGVNVVDQENSRAIHSPGRDERAANVILALGVGQPRLNTGASLSAKRVHDGDSGSSRNLAGEQRALIKAASKMLPPVERNRHNHVEALVPRQGGGHPASHRTGKGLDLFVLEQVNQLAQRAVIFAETIRGLKRGLARAAKRAQSLLIESGAIEKRGPALLAEVFGRKRRRTSQTVRTDRNSGDVCQRTITNAAVFWEKKGKARRCCSAQSGPGNRKMIYQLFC